MQVAEAFHRYGRAFGTQTVPIYGGQAFDQQIRALRRGVHVVIATPGRALDHIRRGTIEAMGCGAPIVASDLPAFQEVAGEEAVLIPAADPDAWAEATIGLLADPARRGGMSRAGRDRALGFAWPLVADRLLAVYQRACGAAPPGAASPVRRPGAEVGAA